MSRGRAGRRTRVRRARAARNDDEDAGSPSTPCTLRYTVQPLRATRNAPNLLKQPRLAFVVKRRVPAQQDEQDDACGRRWACAQGVGGRGARRRRRASQVQPFALLLRASGARCHPTTQCPRDNPSHPPRPAHLQTKDRTLVRTAPGRPAQQCEAAHRSETRRRRRQARFRRGAAAAATREGEGRQQGMPPRLYRWQRLP